MMAAYAANPATMPVQDRKELPLIGAFTSWLHTYMAYRRTFNELSKLGPRELDDLGIGHYEIDRIAREAVGLDKF